MPTLVRPVLLPDGSVPPEFYDTDYWERGAESGKMSYNTNTHTLEMCKYWAEDTLKRWGPFDSYLELGCGKGWALWGLLHLEEEKVFRSKNGNRKKKVKREFSQLVGVDFSRYAIDTAPEEVRSLIQCQSVTDLAFANDRMFDLIFSNDLLEHLTEIQAYGCLGECKRVANRRIVHLISIGDNVDVSWGEIPSDGDQSHINMKTIGWWAHRFMNVFNDANEWEVVMRRHGRTAEFDVKRLN